MFFLHICDDKIFPKNSKIGWNYTRQTHLFKISQTFFVKTENKNSLQKMKTMLIRLKSGSLSSNLTIFGLNMGH
jgi:hypothetical protein